ncbi:MAG: dicarboxylate/amino acid:cation symporter [Gemmatimonadota bacterium]
MPSRLRAPDGTTLSIAALVLGLVLGSLAGPDATPGWLSASLQAAANLWLDALQATIVPMVVLQMLVAVTGGGERAGALGVRALVLFVAMLVAGAVVALIASPPLIAFYNFDPDLVRRVSESTVVPPDAAERGAMTLTDWLRGIIPRNVFQAAAAGEILPLLILAGAFGFAVRAIDRGRDSLTGTFRSLSEAMLVLVKWILVATPVAVFALSYLMAVNTGWNIAGLLAAFVVIQCLVMLIFCVLLYPATAILSRASVGEFARGVAPAQVVALTTRSSIASLPALIEGGRRHLGLSPGATGVVLPLSVAVFKVNRTLSAPMKLLFMAEMYGIALGPQQIIPFVLTVILLSFASVGVPGGGSAFKTMPAYLAAGVPIEGVVLLEAVDAIPDIVKTVVNVTGDMSVATILDGKSPTVNGVDTQDERAAA